MSHTNLIRLDLNLLLVFHALMTERSVTRAGIRLHLTQGAVSHALARLREYFEDPLFVRSKQGMQPTARALELATPIQSALSALDAAVGPLAFDPGTSQHSFRIASTDYFSALILPRIITRLETEAPHVDIQVVPHVVKNVGDLFDNDEIEFAVGFFSNELRKMLPPYCDWTTLTEDYLVCAMRKDHPLASRTITLDEYLNCTHLKYSSGAGSTSTADQYLELQNLARRAGVTISHYLAAPMILQNTNMIMTIPSRMARLFGDHYGLHWGPIPFSLPEAPTQLVWGTRMERHPAHIWLRSVIMDVASSV